MRLCLIFILSLFISATTLLAGEGKIRVVTISDPITPVIAQFLQRHLLEAAQQEDRLLLIEIDTPGGLDTAMRQIIKDIFASPVPVVVYVAPSGARAASAGAIITLAADISAMAPGTNIGAAHPVSLGAPTDKIMEEKVVNDAAAYVEGIARKRGRNEVLAEQMVRGSLSLSVDAALAGKIIDLIASDRNDLLRQLEGRSVLRDGKEIVLQLADVEVVVAQMEGRERILNVISNPNVAYVLMLLGVLGLFFELSNPGVILPGVIGAISLILAFFAFQTLPVNSAGVMLILLALVLFIAEINIVSYGMLSVGGVIAMILGSLLLFDSSEPYMRVSWSVIAVTVVAVTGFFFLVVAKVLRAHQHRATTGQDGLIGQEGRADSSLALEGKVFVNGEYWDAWSEKTIAAGENVVVVAVEGMRLKVKKI